MLLEKCSFFLSFVCVCVCVWCVFSFPPTVYVGAFNLMASIPGPSILTLSDNKKENYDPLRFLITIIIVFSAHKYFIDFFKKMWHVTYQNNL